MAIHIYAELRQLTTKEVRLCLASPEVMQDVLGNLYYILPVQYIYYQLHSNFLVH